MTITRELGRKELRLNQIAVVIPSYEPGQELITFLDELLFSGFQTIVIVNDGSSKIMNSFLRNARRSHDVNRGKGAALRMGFQYISDGLPNINTIITADCDGQHLVKDMLKIVEAVDTEKNALWLGIRDSIS